MTNTNNNSNEHMVLDKSTALKEIIKVKQLDPQDVLQEGDYMQDSELVSFQKISFLTIGKKVSEISPYFGKTFKGFFRKIA